MHLSIQLVTIYAGQNIFKRGDLENAKYPIVTILLAVIGADDIKANTTRVKLK